MYKNAIKMLGRAIFERFYQIFGVFIPKNMVFFGFQSGVFLVFWGSPLVFSALDFLATLVLVFCMASLISNEIFNNQKTICAPITDFIFKWSLRDAQVRIGGHSSKHSPSRFGRKSRPRLSYKTLTTRARSDSLCRQPPSSQ